MIAPPPSLLPPPLNKEEQIHITETPRDAMQGWSSIIPAWSKSIYISLLLKAGFDTVDVGSFVSPKAVPQMEDTGLLITILDYCGSTSKIMVVVGNIKGGMTAMQYHRISIISFPYSTSPTFLQRNINSNPQKALHDLLELKKQGMEHGKTIRVYLSMAFGNPYKDAWSEDQILGEVDRLQKLGFHDIVLSDITGEGTPDSIGNLCSRLVQNYRELTLGIHLHTHPHDWEPKVLAAWQAGFRFFESAMGGFGGCPMTGFELLGNLDTMNLVRWADSQNISTNLVMCVLEGAHDMAKELFI